MEKQIFNKLSQLISIKGTKMKAEWVRDNLSEQSRINDLIMYILRIQFDPTIKTNLAKKSMKANIKECGCNEVINDLNGLLDYVTTKCTGRDVDISTVLSYLNDLECYCGKEVRDMIENVVIKNLKLGITGKAINDSLGKKAIYTFDVWKGHALKDYDKINGRRLIVTPKLDGYRSLIFKDTVFSTNGIPQPLSNFPEIELCMSRLPKNYTDKYIFDGEMLYNKETELDRITRYNKTSSIMGSDGIKKDLTFHTFDVLAMEEFDNGVSKYCTIDRKQFLNSLLLEYQEINSEVAYVNPLYVGNDLEIVKDLFTDAITKGDEGLILQTTEALYRTTKVSDGMWKLKVRDTGDLKVIGFEEGKETGKHKGTLGMMLVEYKGSVCGVGSGFKELINLDKYPTEHTRDWIWNNKDSLIGKIAEIEYDENKDKDGNFNLRHGVFLRWRTDKTEPSYN
ncbi:MAG: hypothetical protein ACRDBY_00855 [Cetobacterium sp.]